MKGNERGFAADGTCPGQRAADCTREVIFGLSRVVLWRRPSKGGSFWDFCKSGAVYNRGFHLAKMARAIPSTEQAAVSPTYEDALAELERLVAAMEGGQLPLDKLLESYKRGAELLSFCRARLEAVEQQVKVLEDGELKPWTSA